jgi:DNA-binding CsgD family transcriptional regulator
MNEANEMHGGNCMDDLARIARVSQIYAQASNANDYCRRLTHDPDLGKGMLGTQLYALSNRGSLHLVGSYGLEAFDPQSSLTLFEEHPISEAINSRTVWFGKKPIQERELTVWVLPLIKGDVPVGAATSLTDPKVEIKPFSPDATVAASNAGAIYLESLGLKNLFRETTQTDEGQLTDRQYEILLGMARGETNAQIARQLILSESSIKQESVKIFRALGVGSRQQAVAKAKATGLIPQAVFAEEVA